VVEREELVTVVDAEWLKVNTQTISH